MTDTKAAVDYDLLEVEKILNGGDDYTQHLTARYLLNMMKNTPPNTPMAYRFCSAAMKVFPAEMKKIEFPTRAYAAQSRRGKKETVDLGKFYEYVKKAPRDSVDPDDWRKLENYLKDRLESTAGAERPAIAVNLMRLADRLGFKAEDKEAIEFLYVAEADELDAFVGMLGSGDRKAAGAIAARMLDRPKSFRRLDHLFGPESPLVKYGLYYLDSGSGSYLPESDEELLAKLDRNDLGDEELATSILGKPATTELDLDDFTFIGPRLNFMIDMIRGAVERGERGINILIYGPPGGGKTELAKAVAKHLELLLYAVGEEDGIQEKEFGPIHDADGDFMGMTSYTKNADGRTSQKRLGQLLRTQALLTGNRQAIALFDEIEDLLLKGTDSEKKADTDSKIQINRLLENNPAVTIWIGNDIDKFHKAVQDRFSFQLYVDYPPTLVRKKIWERQLDIKGVKLPGEQTLELARTFDATPRQIEHAARAAAITGKGMEAIKVSCESNETAFFEERIARTFRQELISTEGRDGPEAVTSLIERGRAKQPFALMAKGAKGTGVNTALRYIGEQMTMNVLEVSMKELSQPTQFSTPQDNVRAAFNAAAAGRKFLIIKDLEHMVPDPQSLSAKWRENELVDTFIRHARAHKLPFAVTARHDIEFPDDIKSLFPDNLGFAPLGGEQAREAYKVFMGHECPVDVELPDKLTPSDFSHVRRLLIRKGDEKTPEKIVPMLAAQLAYRAAQSKTMGFGR